MRTHQQNRRSANEAVHTDTHTPLSFSAPSAYNDSSARSSVSAGGGSMKSKFMRSWMPSDLSMSTTLPAVGVGLEGQAAGWGLEPRVWRDEAFKCGGCKRLLGGG